MKYRLYPMSSAHWLMMMLGAIAVILASHASPVVGEGANASLDGDSRAALQAIVSKYLDEQLEKFKIGNASPDLPPGTQERFGRAAIMLEQIRQAQQRDNDKLVGAVLRRYACGPEFFPEHADTLTPVLREGLESSSELYRLKAADWVAFNHQYFDEADVAAARKVSLELFIASKGQEAFWNLRKIGSKAEIPAIRRLYEQHYRRQLNHTCHNALRFELPRRRPAQVLFLLAELGDPKALQEIRAAIVQEEDVQRRAWGLFIAMNLKGENLRPLAIKMLDDKRAVPEEIDEWGDPDAKNPQQRYLASVRTRVCDVAVRALYAIADAPEDWPVKEMPFGGEWRLDHGYSLRVFNHKEPGERAWQDDRTAVVREWVAGFTDDELAAVKKYVQN